MNEITSKSTLAHPYIDVRAELEAQLYTDLSDAEPEDAYYRRLPAPNPDYPEVLVHNDHTPWGLATWHVACDVGILAADAEEVLALAAALTEAGRQARILNAPGRVLSVPDMILDPAIVSAGDDAPVRRLIIGREPDGQPYNSFREHPHLAGEPIGHRWGDDGFEFEYMGRFAWLGAEIRDGLDYSVFAEVLEEPTHETHPTHTDADGEDG